MAPSVQYLPSAGVEIPSTRIRIRVWVLESWRAGELEGGSAVKSVSCCCRDLSLVPSTCVIPVSMISSGLCGYQAHSRCTYILKNIHIHKIE